MTIQFVYHMSSSPFVPHPESQRFRVPRPHIHTSQSPSVPASPRPRVVVSKVSRPCPTFSHSCPHLLINRVTTDRLQALLVSLNANWDAFFIKSSSFRHVTMKVNVGNISMQFFLQNNTLFRKL